MTTTKTHDETLTKQLINLMNTSQSDEVAIDATPPKDANTIAITAQTTH